MNIWDLFFRCNLFIDELNGWVVGGNPNPKHKHKDMYTIQVNGGITWENAIYWVLLIVDRMCILADFIQWMGCW